MTIGVHYEIMIRRRSFGLGVDLAGKPIRFDMGFYDVSRTDSFNWGRIPITKVTSPNSFGQIHILIFILTATYIIFRALFEYV